MRIQDVVFQRTKDSVKETGIIINEGQLIIDSKGHPVMPVLWNYHYGTRLCIEWEG